MKETIKEQMDAVLYSMVCAKAYGLEIEVITFAMRYLKDNPDKGVKEALSYGLNEWIK